MPNTLHNPIKSSGLSEPFTNAYSIVVCQYQSNTEVLSTIIDEQSFHSIVIRKNIDALSREVDHLRPDLILIDLAFLQAFRQEILSLKKNFVLAFYNTSGYINIGFEVKCIHLSTVSIDNRALAINAFIRSLMSEHKNNMTIENNAIHITKREQEVMQFLKQGYSHKMISHALDIGVETVRTYLKRLFAKLDAHCAIEAINAYQRMVLQS